MVFSVLCRDIYKVIIIFKNSIEKKICNIKNTDYGK